MVCSKYSKAVYVVSCVDRISRSEYKIGHHTGGIKKLKCRYVTYIPDLQVDYFVERDDAVKIEGLILTENKHFSLIIFVFSTMFENSSKFLIIEHSILVNWCFSVHFIDIFISKTITNSCQQFT